MNGQFSSAPRAAPGMARSRKRQSAIQAPCGWLPWCFSAPPTHREPQLPVRVYWRGRFEPDEELREAPCGWLPWCFSAPPTHREPQLPVRVYRRGRFEPDGYLGLICAHRPYQSSLCCLEPQGPRCEVRKRASRFGTVEASDTTLLGLAVTVRYSLINPHRFGGADKHQSRNAP